MSMSINQLQTIFDEGMGFADLLPYIECNDEDVFTLSDGSLGRIWKIDLYETEGKEEQVLMAASGHLENLINRIPVPNLACQIILRSHKQITDDLNKYREYKEGTSPLNIFSESKIKHIEQARQGFFEGKPNNIIPRKTEAYLALRFFPKWNCPTILEKGYLFIKGESASIKQDLYNDLDRCMEEFRQYCRLIETTFQAGRIRIEIMDESAAMNCIYRILNPVRSESIPSISLNERSILREQILFNVPTASGYGFILENNHMRVVSLKELPSSTTPGMFSRELFEGSRFCVLDVDSELMIAINFSVPPLQQALDHLQIQKGMAFLHQQNWLGDKSVEVLEKKKELDETIGELYKSGQKIAQTRVHFILTHSLKERVQEDADKIINLLSRLNCQGIKEELIGASLFLTCLPLNFDPYFERFVRRAKRMVASNAADLLPLYGSFKGTATPSLLYLNRRGETVFLDFFDSNINPHGVVIGASGAGKSFFINDFILQNDRLGAHFFVLDKGDSYKKLYSIMGGQYVNFELNNPVRINPFANDPTPENLSFLMSLLSQMASGGDERDRLNREEEGLMQKAVVQLYETKEKGKEIVLSDLIKLLNDNQFNEYYGINSVMGPTLALRLSPFTSKGPYGKFFDGPNEFVIKGRFTVFELANLNSYKDLQLAVFLNLIFFITAFVSSEQMKPKRKFLLIDEAWSLLRIKNTADFIASSFKTFRKYRCSVVAITQELSDLTRHETGLAIIANSSNKVFLKQEPSLIDLLKSSLSLTESIIEILKTVETIKGKYSEALIVTDSSVGVVRLIPDPFLYWTANSEARNTEFLLDKVRSNNGDFIKALHECVKEHPYGIR